MIAYWRNFNLEWPDSIIVYILPEMSIQNINNWLFEIMLVYLFRSYYYWMMKQGFWNLDML
jgi:hypothetical protein